MENKKFKEEQASQFYHQFICVIVQYNDELNNEKLIKIMKSFQNERCDDKVSRKGFHYRLAKDEKSYELSGYRHNSVTPFLLNQSLPIVISKKVAELSEGYFWLGGGHENTKLRKLIRDQP